MSFSRISSSKSIRDWVSELVCQQEIHRKLKKGLYAAEAYGREMGGARTMPIRHDG